MVGTEAGTTASGRSGWFCLMMLLLDSGWSHSDQ